ncbi:V-type proton ATPase 116 kDa subunit a-like isoform X1 [Anneissia japonica]|uniref:V-type proton ATPase 116 kDa subunit a-like isoform X1 n=1 Tax=Anneissia japonica TaxID=1529436 RepID=UPI0014254D39|nr:V-type proton ATPase 116 kDa subunit a-like isoform X1 [Anneissia japonica]XP_033099672.1 V-type proton ATPase 116 kDa subunit a-like isoform X1 [Anneissia japonica]
MGSLFRSEEMTLAQLFLQSEAAYACVAELGELGLVQFRDLNPDVNAFQRKFVNEVRRCDEMERKLRFLEKEIQRANIPIVTPPTIPDSPIPREMIDLEACFEKLENEMKEVNTNQEALKRNFLELTELKHILRKTQHFFDESSFSAFLSVHAELHHHQMHDADKDEENHLLLGDDEHRQGVPMRLGFLAGVINRERIPAFEQMLWRVCHGNVFLRQAVIDAPLEDPTTGDQVHKNVFIIFFQGEQLKSRVKKICEGFRASLYPCPEMQSERREMAMGVMTRIEDLNTVLGQTEEHRQRVLHSAASNIRLWFIKVRKLKAVYHTLNLFNLDVTQKCLIGECWCPVSDLEQIQAALRRGTEKSGSSVPSILNKMISTEQPPTYNNTNKFTSVFQGIVDAYGVASYREVNPAPYAIITFPFLFGVMFGDLGHGFIMFLIGLWLVVNERKLQETMGNDEVFGIFLGGRYIILLMGAFAMYVGFIYNDVFSRALNVFGSTWNVSAMNFSEELLHGEGSYILNPNVTVVPYPYGIDPIWQLAGNKIGFLNSYKMKMSVIIGVTQMVFGVILGIFNHIYFKRFVNIWCEFIPQLIFLTFIFGYMCFLIIFKWFRYSGADSDQAPSLIITMINMFLFTEGDMMFKGQFGFQVFLLLIAVAAVPWMLLAKPIISYREHNSLQGKVKKYQGARMTKSQQLGDDTAEIIHHDDLDESESTSSEDSQQEEFEFGETLIYSGIHTIEYCLGCISHTASYLRLWALSLAHAELSEVLWTMVLRLGLSMEGWIGCIAIYLLFAFWAVLTVAILIFMEGLSAFLHTLRLHWVEFQSKFYKGEGHPFRPFSFEPLLDDKEEA